MDMNVPLSRGAVERTEIELTDPTNRSVNLDTTPTSFRASLVCVHQHLIARAFSNRTTGFKFARLQFHAGPWQYAKSLKSLDHFTSKHKSCMTARNIEFIRPIGEDIEPESHRRFSESKGFRHSCCEMSVLKINSCAICIADELR